MRRRKAPSGKQGKREERVQEKLRTTCKELYDDGREDPVMRIATTGRRQNSRNWQIERARQRYAGAVLEGLTRRTELGKMDTALTTICADMKRRFSAEAGGKRMPALLEIE